MTAIAGVTGAWPQDALERSCRASLDAQTLYSRRPPQVVAVDGAAFGAAIFPTTPEELNDRQPLQLGDVLLAADVRADNRVELIAALNEPALNAGSADSEIVLAGWLRWKHGLFDRLLGSYAIALFDRPSRTLVLARGPIGDRPLCYRIDGDCMRFASMPSGLIDGRFDPNLDALARQMVLGDMQLGETPFANVQTVLPGHYLEWSPAGLRLVRFWRPPPVDPSMCGDVRDEFRHLLDESVRCRLRRPGGPVASHLSAGFDSSAVTSTAALIMPDRRDLIAFTMVPAPGLPVGVPRNYIGDEGPLSSQTAHSLGIEQRMISDSSGILDCIRGHATAFQAPVPLVTNQGWGSAIDAAASGAGAKVLFNGTQGNATISYGGIDLLSEWLKHGRLIDYFRQSRALVRSGAARWRGTIFYAIDIFVPPRLWSALAGQPPSKADELFIRPDWVRRVADDRIGSDYDAPGLRQMQYAVYANADPGIYTKGTLGKNGFDERDPTADIRLLDFSLRLPASQYIDNGVTRRLAREGLADRLPPAIIANRLRGYQSADWFARLRPESALEWIEQISANRYAAELIDFEGLRRDVTQRWDTIARMAPVPQYQWGSRFTRAIAVGAFLDEASRDAARMGRR